MRITKVAGLTVAGAAVVGALVIGGVAFADTAQDGGSGEVVLRIESTEGSRWDVAPQFDCPEQDAQPEASAAGSNL
ncbi:hypothetical protein ABZS66_16655 [Dactylosporangium sp. NPDC005572]|uniref:hypothetical protein n=1 Tax=Dactylosporangium sp. NPDC005572 TaxID=3156889 RepID=UPI0033B399E1